MTARELEGFELWDGRVWPAVVESDGLPEFRFRQAPDGLLTRRQLRDAGLSPGGQEPYGRIVWKREQRFAWLYREDLAAPKRVPTPAQLAAVEAALAARKVCVECGPVDHTVRTTDHLCGDCYAAMVDVDEVDQAATDEVTDELLARYRTIPATDDPFRADIDPDGIQVEPIEARATDTAVQDQHGQDQQAVEHDGETGNEPERPGGDRAQIAAVWSGTEVTDALERARRALDDLVARQLRTNSRRDEDPGWSTADTAPAVAGDGCEDWRERGVA
ncbi:RRQRL motif-containing zinc-binding protein [Microlunatus parietis]|uniref:Uncharacterized protein n=1 Tax=Microlunatus parietis TaxID=682979 RepID=A0A7Y9LCP1_9ACTN|nr:RRQRL motif-containing zinc-binding protein [Microlunatus parietis]NYE71895.1 hypothetical protein [Microlunatus parietis]